MAGELLLAARVRCLPSKQFAHTSLWAGGLVISWRIHRPMWASGPACECDGPRKNAALCCSVRNLPWAVCRCPRSFSFRQFPITSNNGESRTALPKKKRKEKKETDKYYSSLFQCAASLFCTLIRKWLHCNPHFQQQLP